MNRRFLRSRVVDYPKQLPACIEYIQAIRRYIDSDYFSLSRKDKKKKFGVIKNPSSLVKNTIVKIAINHRSF